MKYRWRKTLNGWKMHTPLWIQAITSWMIYKSIVWGSWTINFHGFMHYQKSTNQVNWSFDQFLTTYSHPTNSLKDYQFEPNEIMVSFDIDSMHTNISVDEAEQSILLWLKSITIDPVKDICDIFEYMQLVKL